MRISVTSILLAALIVVHGLPLSIYLTATGPDTFVYEAALAYVDADEVRSRLAYALALMFVAVVAGIQITNVPFRNGASEEGACLVAGCSFGVFTFMSTSPTTAMVTGGLLLLPVLSFVIFGSDGQLRITEFERREEN